MSISEMKPLNLSNRVVMTFQYFFKQIAINNITVFQSVPQIMFETDLEVLVNK